VNLIGLVVESELEISIFASKVFSRLLFDIDALNIGGLWKNIKIGACNLHSSPIFLIVNNLATAIFIFEYAS
jgi:hypothetical protein